MLFLLRSLDLPELRAKTNLSQLIRPRPTNAVDWSTIPRARSTKPEVKLIAEHPETQALRKAETKKVHVSTITLNCEGDSV